MEISQSEKAFDISNQAQEIHSEFIESKDKKIKVFFANNHSSKKIVLKILQQISKPTFNSHQTNQNHDCETINRLDQLRQFKIIYYKTDIILSRKPLLKQLTHIHLPNTKIIHLKHVTIQSLEALTFLNCPILQELEISNTNTFNIKPFHKLNFPHLKQLFQSITLENFITYKKLLINAITFPEPNSHLYLNDVKVAFPLFNNFDHENSDFQWKAEERVNAAAPDLTFLLKIFTQSPKFVDNFILSVRSVIDQIYQNCPFNAFYLNKEQVILYQEMPLLIQWLKSVSRFLSKKPKEKTNFRMSFWQFRRISYTFSLQTSLEYREKCLKGRDYPFALQKLGLRHKRPQI